MSKFILATKQNMSQVFSENGAAFPATLLKAGPVSVTQIKTKEKDGYQAVQVGYGKKKSQNKALKGHLKGNSFRTLKEFPLEDGMTHAVGDSLDVSLFAAGDMVVVSGVSKGKGFQGVVKRHGFRGGPGSHGNKHSFREPGSIGGGGRAGGRVVKGMRMGGRMGGDRVTIKNLRVLAVDTEKGEMLVSGAVPGRRGTLLEIRSANFKKS
ncbi:MAG: 50S ribosomal protein L3 [Parcubacteria group bacterium]|nr:50S ribosomal protein L3 [Parcubacteria group bacterium]MBI2049090.1 50S ribosomal protein L3 [Parcubacteria group bacterium]